MIIIAQVLYIILSTCFVWAVEDGNQDNDESFVDSLLNLSELKRYSRPSKQIGYQTDEAKRDRRIALLLKKNGNGIYNYGDARKAADEYMNDEREKRRDKLRKLRNEYKNQPVTDRTKTYYPPPGYRSNKKTIERRTKSLMRKNPNLSQIEAKQKAEKECALQIKEHNQRKRERRLLKKLNSEPKDPIKVRNSTGKGTYEAKRKRKYNELLKVNDYEGKLIHTPEQAEILSNEHIKRMKENNTEQKRRQRERKKMKIQPHSQPQ